MRVPCPSIKIMMTQRSVGSRAALSSKLRPPTRKKPLLHHLRPMKRAKMLPQPQKAKLTKFKMPLKWHSKTMVKRIWVVKTSARTVVKWLNLRM